MSTTRATPVVRALTALVVATALVALSGCTASTDDDGATESSRPVPVGAAATTTQGAELRAALTYLLTERTFLLVGSARALTAAGGSLDDPAVRSGLDALDASASATADALSAAYTDARPVLLPALRAHDSVLVQHVALLTGGDVEGAERVLGRLPELRNALAEAVRRVVPRLREQDVADVLRSGDEQVLEAVHAVVAGRPASSALSRRASSTASSTARMLAAGIAVDRGLGTVTRPAAELRSRLTGLLTEHVALAVGLAGQLAAVGGDVAHPLAQAARAALDANVVALAAVTGEAYQQAALPLLMAGRRHVGQLAEAAAFRAGGPPARPPDAATAMAALRTEIEREVGALPARTTHEVAQATRSLRSALDGAASSNPEALLLLRTAAADVPSPAALLAAAVAENLRLR